MHQQASRLLQWARASPLRLPYHSLFSSICILRQDPSLALGNPAQSKVQIPQNLCCPDIKKDTWDVLRGLLRALYFFQAKHKGHDSVCLQTSVAYTCGQGLKYG